MYTETEGIVLRQTKISSGRRMVVIFSRDYGKISAGTSISESGKNRAALALRPFAHGRYRIMKSGENYHINGCETIKSHYSIGEDIDKYLCASSGMEFTGKLLPEGGASPKLFVLFSEFLDMMELRSKKFETLLVAYEIKALAMSGCAPLLEKCVLCGAFENLVGLSVENGGSFCGECDKSTDRKERLIYYGEFDIVNVINFLKQKPLSSLEGLALGDEILQWFKLFLRSYFEYHLGIGCLKSDNCM